MFFDIHTSLRLLGIHPWELKIPFDEQVWSIHLEVLKKSFSQKILAIGEIGLDRRHNGIAPINFQEIILSWQLDWALEVNRPTLVHCVKAESDLLKILNAKNYKGRFLLHDFNGSIASAKSFLLFDCYFSFGPRLFDVHTKTHSVIKTIPIDRLFFETNEHSPKSLENVYHYAAIILGLEKLQLEDQVFKNLLDFFSYCNDISPTDIINNFSKASI
jgi:TatD DNase family protein